MQGFNRYIPPDYDPKKHATLNAYQGKKHALGKRAAKIDEGILVVRFELPFNIWCGTCENHIGAGVRYNAQKRKVGNYYSTPIFAFRCKCHLCDGWFEIRTDPQNARYVVTEGARQKEETWDPAENGGYAVFDTEAPRASDGTAEGDAFGALEKDTDQRAAASVQRNRIAELGEVSARLSADPYAVSRTLRDRFRAEKKEALAKQQRDDGVLSRYGLDNALDLGAEHDVGADQAASKGWAAARENRGLPTSAVSVSDLGTAVRRNTAAKKFDVFDMDAEKVTRVRLKRRQEVTSPPPPPLPTLPPPAADAAALLAVYGSDGDSD